jgi:hypothetical protein
MPPFSLDAITIDVPHREGRDAGRWVEDATERSYQAIYDMAANANKAFSHVLDGDSHTQDRVFNALRDRFSRLGVRSSYGRIEKVDLTRNNFLKELGIGLLSVKVAVRDARNNNLRFGDERDDPTIGVIPERMGRQGEDNVDAEKVLACFPVSQGAEKLTVLSEELHARGFLPGEVCRAKQVTTPWAHQDQPVIVPQSCVVGVRMPLVNPEQAARSGLNYARTSEVVRMPASEGVLKTGEVYLCRYLTEEAVLRAMNFGKFIDELSAR